MFECRCKSSPEILMCKLTGKCRIVLTYDTNWVEYGQSMAVPSQEDEDLNEKHGHS